MLGRTVPRKDQQGMTDRRSFFRDREVIGDLCLKKRSQGDCDREIWWSLSGDRAVFSLNKTENNSVQNHW